MNAETWLRAKYGAYRGVFYWRQLEEAFNESLNTCTAMLSLTRAEASLMAGEMSAQEWRTVKAVLDAIKRRILE